MTRLILEENILRNNIGFICLRVFKGIIRCRICYEQSLRNNYDGELRCVMKNSE